MRAVVQRVQWARVRIEGEVVGQIQRGLLVLLGAGLEDGPHDVDYLSNKIANLRIFADEQQHMNRSLLEVGGAMLVVSQFTLYGDCRKGRRPSFIGALEPNEAEQLCNLFVSRCQSMGIDVQTGRFRAMMDVESNNEGPVTLLVDSRKQF